MNLKELYFSHTITDSSCPICSNYLNPILTSKLQKIKCPCGFVKFNTGFDIITNSNHYIFNILKDDLDFPLDPFSSYKDLLNYILKLEIFQ